MLINIKIQNLIHRLLLKNTLLKFLINIDIDKIKCYYINNIKSGSDDMGKSGKFRKLGITLLLSCAIALPSVGFAACEKLGNAVIEDNKFQTLEDYKKENAEVYDFMLKTPTGKMVTAKIDESPISVVLKDIPEEDKQAIVDAINDLDEISTNINYEIYESKDYSVSGQIYIKNGEGSGVELGLTTMSYNNYTGKISYPIFININLDECHKITSSETGKNAVEAVAKHELAHTLGFSDLYDEKLKDESIMWYYLNLEDYTDSDEYRIRKLYGGTAEELGERIINSNIPSQNSAMESGEYETKKVACMREENNLSNKNPIAEIYEPRYMAIYKEKDNKFFKKSKKEKEIEEEREM